MPSRKENVAAWANKLRGRTLTKVKVGGNMHQLLRRAYSYPQGVSLSNLAEGNAGEVQKALVLGFIEQEKFSTNETKYFISKTGEVAMHMLNEQTDKHWHKMKDVMISPSEQWINHTQTIIW